MTSRESRPPIPSSTQVARPQPRLIGTATPSRPAGVALVLHGGAGRSAMPVSPTQLSVLRMIPIGSRVARASHGRLAVFRLLNAVRGLGANPLSNVTWALQSITEQYPDLPVALVGHSLGGSVALAAAGHSQVHTVVALAPWLSGVESAQQLRSASTLIVHGERDRVTSAAASASYAAQARALGAHTSFVAVERGGHTMLRRMPTFDLLAARFVHACLDPDTPPRATSGFRSRLTQLAQSACDHADDYRI